MKKLLAASLLLFCIMNAFTSYAFDIVQVDRTLYPIQNVETREGYYFTEINGVPYYMSGRYNMIPYNAREFDFFVKTLKKADYLWTGEYYFVRFSGNDYAPSKHWVAGEFFMVPPIELYDSEFNLVKSYTFDVYPLDLAYYDGYYYAYIPYSAKTHQDGDSTWMKSSDFENWEACEAPPRSNGIVTHKSNKMIYMPEENAPSYVSFDDGTTFTQVTYEDMGEPLTYKQIGEIIIKQDRDRNLYFSTDDVYFLKAEAPPDSASKYGANLQEVYEMDGVLVAGWLATPAQPLYDELERMKNPTYVKVNNEILGFEELPVTESDRTLVPMRFLFEQLGADVTWDEATETATAKKANTTINFSIDNTTATVNGAETVMDVPARLVGDKTMVPLRFLSEEMGYNVEWDEETRMATITTPLTSRVAKTEEVTFDSWIK